MPLPEFDSNGDLPPGVHRASLEEVVARFGAGTPQRQAVTGRMLRVYHLAADTGKLERFILFGSYVTERVAPNDVDVFLVMARDFDARHCSAAARSVFSHAQAEKEFGASVFWAQQGVNQAAMNDLIEGWQTKRDSTLRGIVEVLR